jgi:pyruvate/2-oxoglutarate/acetoin dehydrogenase E1 component
MNVLEALAAAVADLLQGDVRRVLLGEDVRTGGMLGLSRKAIEDPALSLRVLATPLTPAAGLAHATGLALAGRRPIVLMPSATALLEGYAALRELGRVAATAGGERSAPVLIVAPTGPGFDLGGDAADSPDGVIAAVPGLRVIVLGDASEGPATLRAAASLDDGEPPTVLLLPRALVLRELGADEFKPSLGRPLGAARVVREGSAAAVLAIGAAVDQAFAAVEQSGVDAAIVEVTGLAPLDVDGLAAAATSGKLVIAHAGGPAFGPGAELGVGLADRAILHLDAPVLRVTGSDGPHTGRAEEAALPTVEALAAALSRVATY